MDIIYVSYNSEKWIERCFGSVLKSEYDLKKVNIYVVDNHSSDHTLEKLKKIKPEMEEQVGSFQVMESQENLGFGRGNNLGFSKGNSELVCFFNIDTELLPDTLKELEEAVDASMKKQQCGSFVSFRMSIRRITILLQAKPHGAAALPLL